MRALLALVALVAMPAQAQIVSPIQFGSETDTSNLATKSEVQAAAAAASAAQTAASSAVKTVNGVTPTAGNVAVAVPTASSVVPPGVADSGTAGTMTGIYALANHTHASKARKGRVLVPAAGTLAVTFGSPFAGTPVCATSAEATAGDTNVVNAQLDGTPTTTGMTIRITRTAQSVVALLGLTILSVPTQVATYAHYICIEP